MKTFTPRRIIAAIALSLIAGTIQSLIGKPNNLPFDYRLGHIAAGTLASLFLPVIPVIFLALLVKLFKNELMPKNIVLLYWIFWGCWFVLITAGLIAGSM